MAAHSRSIVKRRTIPTEKQLVNFASTVRCWRSRVPPPPPLIVPHHCSLPLPVWGAASHCAVSAQITASSRIHNLMKVKPSTKVNFKNWPGIKYLQRFGFHWMTLVFGKYSQYFQHPTCEDILRAGIKILGITTKLSDGGLCEQTISLLQNLKDPFCRTVQSIDNLLHTWWHLMNDLRLKSRKRTAWYSLWHRETCYLLVNR